MLLVTCLVPRHSNNPKFPTTVLTFSYLILYCILSFFEYFLLRIVVWMPGGLMLPPTGRYWYYNRYSLRIAGFHCTFVFLTNTKVYTL